MDEQLNEGKVRDEKLRTDLVQGLDQAKVRDEELRDLMKFGLEAREGLRESMQARFNEADNKHDEQIGLLKAVLRDAAKR